MTTPSRILQPSVAASRKPAPKSSAHQPLTAAEPHALRDLRPSLTTYLHQRVAAFPEGFRHNLALVGPVGSGKSVLLQQVLHRTDARVTKIYCALQRGSVREFLRRFTTAVLHAIVDAPADTPLEPLLQQAAERAPNTVAAIQRLDRYATGHFPADGFVQALELIPILHEELRQPCVLVLDECLYLEELGLSHAFHELGKRVMTWPFVMFLLSSSSVSRARDIIRERLHLLFGQFEIITVGSIEPPAAMKWIEEAFPLAKRHPVSAQFLLHWVGAYPWYLTVLLNRMRERTLLQRERLLAEPLTVDAAWDVLGSPDGVLHQWCAAQMAHLLQKRFGALAQEAVIAIAQGARTSQAIAGQCGTTRNLSQALQLLVEHDLVQRKGACWVITDQLLACWLSAVLGPQRLRGALDRARAMELFSQALHTMWSEWTLATHQSLVDRLARLFSQFRDETVCLDHKTGRLPQFATMWTHATGHPMCHYLTADGPERRWCCLAYEGLLEEPTVAAFEQFCKTQDPKPARKIIVARQGVDLNAKLLAKDRNMWVWEPEDVNTLLLLYGQPPLASG